MTAVQFSADGFRWPRAEPGDYVLSDDGARIVLRDVSRLTEYAPDRGALEALLGDRGIITAALSPDTDEGTHFVPKVTPAFAEAALDFVRRFGFLTAPREAKSEPVEDFRYAWWGLYMTAHISDPVQGWRTVPVRPFDQSMLDNPHHLFNPEARTFEVNGRTLHLSDPEFHSYVEELDAAQRLKAAYKRPLDPVKVRGRRLRALADRARFETELSYEGGPSALLRPRSLKDFLWIVLTERDLVRDEIAAGITEERKCKFCKRPLLVDLRQRGRRAEFCRDTDCSVQFYNRKRGRKSGGKK